MPVPVGGEPHALVLAAAAGPAHQRLPAVLHPADRAAEQPGQVDGDDVFRVRLALGSERPAHGGDDDAHLPLGEAERGSQRGP
jgi:hypothetical protein